jgi:hypothetical protein
MLAPTIVVEAIQEGLHQGSRAIPVDGGPEDEPIYGIHLGIKSPHVIGLLAVAFTPAEVASVTFLDLQVFKE